VDLVKVWQQFRDPGTGFWCDTLRFQNFVPCGPSNNFYSSAGTGMGLATEAVMTELGFSSREDAEARLVESMTNLLNDWPRESNRGFMQHFTNRALQVLAEYSTIDTTELVLGALLAGNYFGGRVAELANQLLGATEWSAAIKAGNHSRIYSKVNANTGEMKGNIRPYNEYFLVSYIANLTSAPGSAPAQHYSTFWDAPGSGPPVGDGEFPKLKNYEQWSLLSDSDHIFMSSFIPQFNWFLSRGYQVSPYYNQHNADWLEADRAWWAATLPADSNVWGVPVAGRVWGAGAGPGPSGGYYVDRIQGSNDLVVSAAIMAGFLHVADDQMRETINSELRWLYDNEVCAYNVTLPAAEGGTTHKILWRCSVRLPDWRCPTVDSIDFSTLLLGYATNYLPTGWYTQYAA